MRNSFHHDEEEVAVASSHLIEPSSFKVVGETQKLHALNKKDPGAKGFYHLRESDSSYNDSLG
jgi:hypothetical protein